MKVTVVINNVFLHSPELYRSINVSWPNTQTNQSENKMYPL